jgi:hypothetical protein
MAQIPRIGRSGGVPHWNIVKIRPLPFEGARMR